MLFIDTKGESLFRRQARTADDESASERTADSDSFLGLKSHNFGNYLKMVYRAMVRHRKEMSQRSEKVFLEKTRTSSRRTGQHSAECASDPLPLPKCSLKDNLLFCVREAYRAGVFQHGIELEIFSETVRQTTSEYPSELVVQDALNEAATAALRHAKYTWGDGHLAAFKALVGSHAPQLAKEKVDEVAAKFLKLTEDASEENSARAAAESKVEDLEALVDFA